MMVIAGMGDHPGEGLGGIGALDPVVMLVAVPIDENRTVPLRQAHAPSRIAVTVGRTQRVGDQFLAEALYDDAVAVAVFVIRGRAAAERHHQILGPIAGAGHHAIQVRNPELVFVGRELGLHVRVEPECRPDIVATGQRAGVTLRQRVAGFMRNPV